MKTISDKYRDMNAALHQENEQFGANGHRWAEHVIDLAKVGNAVTALDYGCGKGTLAYAIAKHPQGFLFPPLRQYDPAIPDFAKPPEPADLVICTDVLEHIEPNYLDAVIKDLRRLTKKVGFFVVATRPALKTLADGRNAHLIQKPHQWWLAKILNNFDLHQFVNFGGEFLVIVSNKEVNRA